MLVQKSVRPFFRIVIGTVNAELVEGMGGGKRLGQRFVFRGNAGHRILMVFPPHSDDAVIRFRDKGLGVGRILAHHGIDAGQENAHQQKCRAQTLHGAQGKTSVRAA